MAIDFFEKELRNAQQNFNQTFGVQDVCNLKLRGSAILAIGFLGKACEKINKAEKKDDVRDEIKKFMRTRNVLNNIFNDFEEQQKEGGVMPIQISNQKLVSAEKVMLDDEVDVCPNCGNRYLLIWIHCCPVNFYFSLITS